MTFLAKTKFAHPSAKKEGQFTKNKFVHSAGDKMTISGENYICSHFCEKWAVFLTENKFVHTSEK